MRADPIARPFHFITVVWGLAYIDMFLNVAVATQLSKGNLDSFAAIPGCCFRIFTRRAEIAQMDAHPLLQRVRLLMDVQFVAIDEFFIDDVLAYGDWFIRIMSASHRLAIEHAASCDAALFFLAPDFVFSVGSLKNAADALRGRSGAVMVVAPRLNEEQVRGMIAGKRATDDTVSLEPRELVAMGLEAMHAGSASLFWDSTHFDRNATGIYWRVNQNAFLAQCFHLHPLVVAPADWTASFSDSIDGDYVERACPSHESVRVIDDSDRVAIFSTTSIARVLGGTEPRRATVPLIAYSCEHRAHALHRRLFSTPIRMHAGEWPRTDVAVLCRAYLLIVALRLPRLRAALARSYAATRWTARSQKWVRRRVKATRRRVSRTIGHAYKARARTARVLARQRALIRRTCRRRLTRLLPSMRLPLPRREVKEARKWLRRTRKVQARWLAVMAKRSRRWSRHSGRLVRRWRN